MIVGSNNNRTIERRIERTEFFMTHTGKFCGTFDVDILVFKELNEKRYVVDRRKLDALIDWILNDILNRLKLGVVVPGFCRHLERHVIGWKP